MAAYGDIDDQMAGLKQGLDSRAVSRIASFEIMSGRPVFTYRGDEEVCYPFMDDTGIVTWDGDFSTDNLIFIFIYRDGNSHVLEPVTRVIFNTDQETTMNDLIAQVEADIPGSVARSPDEDNRIIEIELKRHSVVVLALVTGGTVPTNTISYRNSAEFIGVAMFDNQEEAGRFTLAGERIDEKGLYQFGDRVNVMINGLVSVDVGEDVEAEDPVYIIAAGDNRGKFGKTAGSNIPVNGRFINDSNINEVADIRINK